MDHYRLPVEIDKLNHLKDNINDILFDSENFKENVDASLSYIKTRRFELFKNFKEYSDEFVAEQIFGNDCNIDENNIRTYIKYSIGAVIVSLNKLADCSRSLLESGDECDRKKNGLLFRDSVFNLIIFLDYVEQNLNQDHTGFGFGERGLESSTEIFESTHSLPDTFLGKKLEVAKFD
ncbi:MAG: hypothetical protein HQL79_06775 [Magnetococcales bacterium]|nr:hypothetical protein [Magnetococcales bacterium]